MAWVPSLAKDVLHGAGVAEKKKKEKRINAVTNFLLYRC